MFALRYVWLQRVEMLMCTMLLNALILLAVAWLLFRLYSGAKPSRTEQQKTTVAFLVVAQLCLQSAVQLRGVLIVNGAWQASPRDDPTRDRPAATFSNRQCTGIYYSRALAFYLQVVRSL